MSISIYLSVRLYVCMHVCIHMQIHLALLIKDKRLALGVRGDMEGVRGRALVKGKRMGKVI